MRAESRKPRSVGDTCHLQVRESLAAIVSITEPVTVDARAILLGGRATENKLLVSKS